jgi:hypothetical protein
LAIGSDERVVMAEAIALGHRQTPKGISVLLPLIHHANLDFRFGVVMGLTGQNDPLTLGGMFLAGVNN